MLNEHFEMRGSSCGLSMEGRPAGKAFKHLAEAAHRLEAMLTVAEMLTEKAQLTEVEVVALDVLIVEGRDTVKEIIWRIAQLSEPTWSAETAHHA